MKKNECMKCGDLKYISLLKGTKKGCSHFGIFGPHIYPTNEDIEYDNKIQQEKIDFLNS